MIGLLNKNEIGILTNEKAVNLIIKHNQKSEHAPNDKYEYSNTNYILLARIIEIVSNHCWGFVENTAWPSVRKTIVPPRELRTVTS